jgi:hypothetical protein
LAIIADLLCPLSEKRLDPVRLRAIKPTAF